MFYIVYIQYKEHRTAVTINAATLVASASTTVAVPQTIGRDEELTKTVGTKVQRSGSN